MIQFLLLFTIKQCSNNLWLYELSAIIQLVPGYSPLVANKNRCLPETFFILQPQTSRRRIKRHSWIWRTNDESISTYISSNTGNCTYNVPSLPHSETVQISGSCIQWSILKHDPGICFRGIRFMALAIFANQQIHKYCSLADKGNVLKTRVSIDKVLVQFVLKRLSELFK